MGLDLKNALALRHRKGELKASPEALYWIFTNLKHQPNTAISAEAPVNHAQQVVTHLWRQAQIQFGEMTDVVLKNWQIDTGKGLATALQELAQMDAVHFDDNENISDYESIALWKSPFKPIETQP